MVAISFSEERFVKLIQQGIKDQTIRPYNPKRFELIKRKKKLQLYYKQRTKECRKIADAELTEIFRIKFVAYYDYWGDECITVAVLNENNGCWQELDTEEFMELVTRDGFDKEWEFVAWFEKRYGKKLYNMEFMVIRFKIDKWNIILHDPKSREIVDSMLKITDKVGSELWG